MTLAEILLDDFNRYRRDTRYVEKLKAKGIWVRAASRKNLPLFEKMAQWCRQNNVEPRRWLNSLFEARHWLASPHLRENDLLSEKHLRVYPTMQRLPKFTETITRELKAANIASGVTFDQRRDIAHGAETLKRRYVASGNYQRCISLMDTETFGYHPFSQICTSCPAAAQCANILRSKYNFDVIALRAGQVTSEQVRLMHG